MKSLQSQGTHMSSRLHASKQGQQGLTLIELLVAMVLGLMVIAAVGSVYLISSRNLSQQDAESRLQQTGAAAMAVVTQQLQKAGMVDLPAEWPGWQVSAPGMDRFGYLMANIHASNASHFPPALHGCDRDYSGSNKLSNSTCKASGTASAALTVAWQVSRTGEGSLAPIITPACLGTTDTAKLPSANVDNLTFVDKSGAVQPVATAWSICRISYDPASSSIQFAQSVDPKATKPEHTDAVAENVADLRFRYLVGRQGDSSRLDRYATAAELNASAAGSSPNWADVTGVEVCLVARVAVPITAQKSYLGCEVDSDNSLVTKDVNDNFIYRAVRSVVVLRSRVQANTASL